MPLGLQTNYLNLIDQAVRALDTACSSPATYSQVRRLTTLLTTLLYYHHTARKEVPATPLQQTAAELQSYKDDLKSRSNRSEQVTIKSFSKLSQNAQNLIGSMLALELREMLDDFSDVDLSKKLQFEALKRAVDRAQDQVAQPQGRPPLEYLDQFCKGITEFARDDLKIDVKVSNHHKGEPVTDFEHMLVIGFRLVDTAISYHGIVKRYHEAIKR
jgi:hypothetical protein